MRRATFRFLDHTADALAECRAPSFHELLETAAQALYSIAFCRLHQRDDIERTITLRGASREDLLIRWLQELICLMDTEYFVMSRCEFEEGDEDELRAHVAGYKYAPEERETEVKAATYHETAIVEDGDDLVARVLFDL